MGMKGLIAGLLVIVLVQGVLLVVQQVHADRVMREIVGEKLARHRDPVVYIAGLTEAMEQHGKTLTVLGLQRTWLAERLDKCLAVLEEINDLEEIPMAPASNVWGPGMMGPGVMMPGMMGPGMMGPGGMGKRSSSAWSRKDQPESKSLYDRFEMPEKSRKVESVGEQQVRKLHCSMNLVNMAAAMQRNGLKSRIENYEERLQRLAEIYDKTGGEGDR